MNTDELERLARAANKGGGWWYNEIPSPDVILALLEERRVLRERLTAIHKPEPGLRRQHPRTLQPTDEICWECDRPWPCDTFAALQAEPARAEAKDGAAEDAMAADRAAALARAEEGAS